MKTQNKVQLIGYVGTDLIIEILPSGTKKVRIRVATHYPIQKENKETQWVTTWHNVVATEEKADHVVNNFSKGSHILVEGPLHYYSFLDRQGILRHMTEIKGFYFLNLDR